MPPEAPLDDKAMLEYPSMHRPRMHRFPDEHVSIAIQASDATVMLTCQRSGDGSITLASLGTKSIHRAIPSLRWLDPICTATLATRPHLRSDRDFCYLFARS